MTVQSLEDRLVAVSEIADIAGVGPSAVSNWRKRQKTFPAPVETGPGGDLFRLSDIVRWLEGTGRTVRLPNSFRERLAAWLDFARRRVDADTAVLAVLQVAAIHVNILRNGSESGERLEDLLEHGESEFEAKGVHRIDFASRNHPHPSLPESAMDAFGDSFYLEAWRLPPQELRELISIIAQMDLEDLADAVPVIVGATDERLTARSSHGTTRGLASILLPILGPLGSTILDPAAGTASLLIQASVEQPGIAVFGQDLNETAWRIGALSLFIMGAEFEYELGDTLRQDAYPGLLVDTVVVDPTLGTRLDPSVDYSGDPRWLLGDIATKTSDLAWLQHAAAHLTSDRGRAAVVVSGAALSQSGSDGALRRHFLESDLLDAVIQLPPGLIAGTSTPALIVLLDANRQNRSGSVLFVDASSIGTSQRGASRRIDASDASQLVAAVDAWRSGELIPEVKFSGVADADTIRRASDVWLPAQYIEYTQRRTEIGAGDQINALPFVVAAHRSELVGASPRLVEALAAADRAVSALVEVQDPSEWPRIRLGDLLASADPVVAGRRVEDFENESWEHPEDATIVRYVSGWDLNAQPIVMSHASELPGWVRDNPVFTRDGDVLVSNAPRLIAGENYGPAATTVRHHQEQAVAHDLVRLRVDEARLLPEYLCLVMSSRYGYDSMDAVDLPGSSGRLSFSRIADIAIPVPDLSAQEQMVDVIHPLVSLTSRANDLHRSASDLTRTVSEALLNQVLAPHHPSGDQR